MITCLSHSQSSSFQDIDECTRGTEECSHGCANTEGSYYCTCADGYELSGDNKTCVGELITNNILH